MADEQTQQPPADPNASQPPAEPPASELLKRGRQPQPPAPPANESESQRINRALTEAAQEAAERKADTMEVNPKAKVDGKPMESGGVYVVDGVKVDAFGRAVKGI